MYNSGDIINFDNQDWIVLFKLNSKGNDYWFVNALNLSTEEFYQDYCFVDQYSEKVIDELIINDLIPLMQERLQNEKNND